MAASNAQVQAFVNNNLRPRCEQIRALLLAMEADRAVMGDVYANVNDMNSTFTDSRPQDNPPHLVTTGDVLAFNTFLACMVEIIRGTSGNDAARIAAVQGAAGQLAVILNCCVRGL